MGKLEEEFAPLFDYSNVQPATFLDLDDDFDSSPVFPIKKRKRNSEEVKKKILDEDIVVLDNEKDEKDEKKEEEEDWLPPPPPKVANLGSGYVEDKTIQELRSKKQELVSLAQSAEDMLRSMNAPVKRDFSNPEKSSPELKSKLPAKQVDRKKIIIVIQDKAGQKHFRIYKDDKFERLFKMYAEKSKVKVENLSFSFDGDKVSPAETPEGLGMEDEDMIEVNIRSK